MYVCACVFPLNLEKFSTDFQVVFDTVFGRDYRVTCAIWEFSKNCHLRTVAVRNMRKSVFWRLQLYFWAYSPHIWNIDAYWHLCTYRSPITRSITELHEQKDKENSFVFPLNLEKFSTDFQVVFDTVFGRDYRVTCAIWEFSITELHEQKGKKNSLRQFAE